VDLAGGSDAARDAVLQDNGKLVVVGDGPIDGRRRFAVARMLTRSAGASAGPSAH
jgi:hypothetical protein